MPVRPCRFIPAGTPKEGKAGLPALAGWLCASQALMTALTATCLFALLCAWVADVSALVPYSSVLSLYVLAYVAGGLPSTVRALRDLAAGKANIDLLMVTAAAGAAIVNEWPEGAFLLFLFSLSNTLEGYVLGRTRRAIEALMDLSPEQATVRRDGREELVATEDLRVGDTLIVRPGERIAADGALTAGRTTVDQSAVTGESMPVEKGPGDPVFAATLNQHGAVEIRVNRLANESTLARIVRLVEEAQVARADSQRFTNWFGSRYTVAVLAAAVLALAGAMLVFGDGFGPAFYRAMVVLVVASPCAVVISIPAVILAAVTGGARGGVLVKGGAHLERAATLRAIAFDKTGTLTIGRPRLVALATTGRAREDEVLRLAASAEALSEHPLAHAMVAAARERRLTLEGAADVQALVGRGVRACVGGRTILVGKPELLKELGALPDSLAATAAEWADAGRTVLFVGDQDGALGAIAVADTLRPGALEALERLRRLGIEYLVMLTGDNRRVARAIAQHLGMDFEAELLPADKLSAINRLRERYENVGMVGDGINDAPSLAAATLGISLGGTGTDVALETADVVLMGDDLGRLPYAIALARQAQVVIRENLVFAFAVMIVLLGGALLGSLRMPYAVLGHEGSTVLVILNALRLLRFRWRGSDAHLPAHERARRGEDLQASSCRQA
jgi:Cd2+/Zn2+-exporting ATPase